MALKTPEHLGQVRGMGFFAIPTNIWGRTPRSRRPRNKDRDAELEELKDGLREACADLSEVMKEIDQLKKQCNPETMDSRVNQEISTPHSERTEEDLPLYTAKKENLPSYRQLYAAKKENLPSYIVTKEIIHSGGASTSALRRAPDGNGFKERRLRLLKTFTRNVVAKGVTVLETDNMLHGMPMPPDHIKVKITEVIKPDEALLIPDPFEGVTIGENLNDIVRWPQKWVQLNNPEDDHQNLNTPRDRINKFQSDFHCYYDSKNIDVILVDITTNVYNDGDIVLNITREEVDWFCTMDELGTNFITLYTCFLHLHLIKNGLDERFSFMDIQFIKGNISPSKEDLISYANALNSYSQTSLVIMILNPDRHWIIVMIELATWKVFYIDPLWRDVDVRFKTWIGDVYKTLQNPTIEPPNGQLFKS